MHAARAPADGLSVTGTIGTRSGPRRAGPTASGRRDLPPSARAGRRLILQGNRCRLERTAPMFKTIVLAVDASKGAEKAAEVLIAR